MLNPTQIIALAILTPLGLGCLMAIISGWLYEQEPRNPYLRDEDGSIIKRRGRHE